MLAVVGLVFFLVIIGIAVDLVVVGWEGTPNVPRVVQSAVNAKLLPINFLLIFLLLELDFELFVLADVFLELQFYSGCCPSQHFPFKF